MLLHFILKLFSTVCRGILCQKGNTAPSKVPLKPQHPAKLFQNKEGQGWQKRPGVSPEVIVSARQGVSSQLFWQWEGFSRCVRAQAAEQPSPELTFQHSPCQPPQEGSSTRQLRRCGKHTYPEGKHVLINHSVFKVKVLDSGARSGPGAGAAGSAIRRAGRGGLGAQT